MKIFKQFQLKIVIFTAVKNRCLLHGGVFVITGPTTLSDPVVVQVVRSAWRIHNLTKIHHGKTNTSQSTIKKQRRGHDRYSLLRDSWRSHGSQTTPLRESPVEPR